ncbi:hypothetical protein R5R35_005492 [Gryllus longicercus]|uniref:Uncharacterized protein n=1 Tax=Gryllus longicercus TaxID=2509291 RepID=A0AAN9VSY7_9ORTH
MAVSTELRDPVKECYDPQCNCPNKKELVLHNQHVSRLPRIELENRFLHVYEDNIRLKTDCNHLRDQLKRLSTRVFRLIESRKSLPLNGAGGFERQALNAEMLLSEQAQHIATLEAENEIWRAKVDAMRQQFLSCRSFTNYKPKNSKKCNRYALSQKYYCFSFPF